MGGLTGDEGGGHGVGAADQGHGKAGHQVGRRKHLDDWLHKSNTL